jgi:hypothetical protein
MTGLKLWRLKALRLADLGMFERIELSVASTPKAYP